MRRDVIEVVADLTADNRHTVAMYLTARRFGLLDLCAEFRSIHRQHRLKGDLSDALINRRHTAFNEMRRRVLGAFGVEMWDTVKL